MLACDAELTVVVPITGINGGKLISDVDHYMAQVGSYFEESIWDTSTGSSKVAGE